MLSSRNAWRTGTIRAAQRLPEPLARPSNSAKTMRAARPHHRRLAVGPIVITQASIDFSTRSFDNRRPFREFAFDEVGRRPRPWLR